MVSNPLLGLVFHWIGGLASASFYLPYQRVRQWSWETYWLAGGFFSWIIAPWVFALALAPGVMTVLRETPWPVLGWTYFYGALWGLGNLTFGLTMRYLGISLGMAMVLGYCAAFGTIMPPIFNGTFVSQVLGTHSGQVILLGVGVCLAGIALSGTAGVTKEKEMSEAQKRAVIKEFNFRRGLLVATFSGVLSACFSYGLNAGTPMRALGAAQGATPVHQGLYVLIVVLLGGFTTNFIWCVVLHVKNGTGAQYFSARRIESRGVPLPIMETAIDAPAQEMARQAHIGAGRLSSHVPLAVNWLFCAAGGVCWYLQFFFYTMGESQMGRYKFSSWALHMASIIIFSTLWGLALAEWRGASRKAMTLLTFSLIVLVGSTMIIGWGNFLATAK